MPYPSTVLVFRADYETATNYLSYYLQKIVNRATQLGFNVIDLVGLDATQTKFFEALETSDPLIVVAGGHGNENGFYGQNDEQILQACTNDQVMSARQGIFSSCSVGVNLGPSMVEKSAKWFAGWRADYVFMYDDAAEVSQDTIARPFMEAIIQPALTRIEGGGPSQILSATINKFNVELQKLWNSPDPLAQDMITLLLHDRDNFMVTGVTSSPTALSVGVGVPLLVGGLIVGHFAFGFP